MRSPSSLLWMRKKPTGHRLFVHLTVASQLAWTPLAQGAAPLTEEEGVRRVCARGPQHDSARAKRLRGRAEVAAAATLPNPSLIVEHQQSLEGGTERETIVGASVPLSVSGRRSLLADAAAARAESANWRATGTLFEAALAFRRAYLSATIEARRLQILEEQQSRLEALERSIQRLSERGETAGYDLSRQHAQVSLHKAHVNRSRARARSSLAVLSGWTGAEVTLAAPPLEELAGGARVAARFASSPRHPHPHVLAAAAERRASELDARAARRRWVPDVELFGGYRTVTSGSETGRGLSLALSVPLALFDRGQGEAAVAEAESAVARTTANLQRHERGALARAAFVELAALEASVSDSQQAVTHATLVQDNALELYGAGELTLSDLLEAFRSAEEARLERVSLAELVAEARLSLMHATGTFFEPPLDRACQAAGAPP